MYTYTLTFVDAQTSVNEDSIRIISGGVAAAVVVILTVVIAVFVLKR